MRVLPGVTPRVLVSDTVGFIKKLPHDLVASFRATLDEAASAELLLHVVDASDPAFRSHMTVTLGLLEELAAEAPKLLLLNKIDRVDPVVQAALREEYPEAMLLSAHRPDDVRALVERIARFFERDTEEQELFVPWSQSSRLSFIHERCRILSTQPEADGTRFRVRVDPDVGAALADLMVLEGRSSIG